MRSRKIRPTHSDGLVAGNWAEFFSRAHHQRGHATVAAFSIGRRPPCSGQCRRPGRTRRGRRSAERGRRRRRRLRPGTSTLAPSQNPPPFSLQCVVSGVRRFQLRTPLVAGFFFFLHRHADDDQLGAPVTLFLSPSTRLLLICSVSQL